MDLEIDDQEIEESFSFGVIQWSQLYLNIYDTLCVIEYDLINKKWIQMDEVIHKQ